MHRVVTSRAASSQRRITDKGELRTVHVEEELEKLPFSARTPRVQRDKSRPQSSVNNTIRVIPKTSRPSTQMSNDPISKIRELVREGSRCSSTVQKHEIIKQIGDTAIEYIANNNLLKSDVDRLTAKVVNLEEIIESQKIQAAQAAENTEKYEKLRHMKSLMDKEKVAEDIRKIEQDSMKYLHLSEPWLLKEILESNDSDQIEKLINLKFRRLEDLIYGLRRQLLQDQDITALLPIVTQKFGSVRNLLARYNEAMDKIDRLKVREYRLSADELLKRRPLMEMDTAALHTLVVALQNELSESKVLLKQLISTTMQSGSSPLQISEDPAHDELATKYNDLEVRFQTLTRRCADLEKEKEMLQQAVNLESDVLKNGLFKMDERLRGQIKDVIIRMDESDKRAQKAEESIALHQKLVAQFQREKASSLRSRLILGSKIDTLTRRAEDAELSAKNTGRRFEAMRGICRLLAESAISPQSKKAEENIEKCFIDEYIRYDNAALIIQNAWRGRKNPGSYMRLLKQSAAERAISVIPQIYAADIIACKMPPVKYRQVVQLLHSYHNEVSAQIRASVERSTSEFRRIKDHAWDACENVLCKGRRYVWTQTETEYTETETQTEKVISTRSKRGASS